MVTASKNVVEPVCKSMSSQPFHSPVSNYLPQSLSSLLLQDVLSTDEEIPNFRTMNLQKMLRLVKDIPTRRR